MSSSPTTTVKMDAVEILSPHKRVVVPVLDKYPSDSKIWPLVGLTRSCRMSETFGGCSHMK
jgi:hypothetical protein